jgi:hypothetical protein
LTISATFKIASDIIISVINGNNLMFMDSNNNIAVLEGLKLSYQGVLKEFPDLKDNDNWKSIALKRLKEKIKSFNTEMEKIIYIKNELTKFGYEPLYYQQHGWRAKKFT